MKRKSTDENSAAAAAPHAAAEAGHSKKRRLSNEAAHGAAAAEAKRVKKDKTAKKDPKDKGKKDKKAKKTREEQAAALDAVYDQDDMDVDQEPQTEDGADRPKDGSATDAQSAQPAAADKKKKSKKSKKEKKPAAGEGGADDDDDSAPAGNAGQQPQPKKAARFIVFVGNLPYSAKADDVQKHFAAVHPTAVRLMHEKTNPNKSRGIAFVEFAGYDHMKTCLKTLHHSTLTCEGRDHRGRPKTEERKINVELTAGGGGNTDYRKEKIRAKNEKLAGERHRRAEAEEKEKLKKEKKRLLEGGEKKGDDEGVHPSRRARVPGGPR